ncbi:MAG: 4Fe-4S binding protein, partial [Desulfovibrionaceae bacterium]|nr:4Fe-4S binding protein [Desulfovibrionaceae bacterium]
MLKTLRLALAVLCLCGFLLLFLFPGAAASVPALAWLARIQLAPAVLAGSLVIAGAHLLCALLFGRVYCSIVCPLGLLQDLAGRIVSLGLFRGHYRGPAHGRFRWAAIPAWPRTLVLLVSAAAFAAGMPLLLSLLEPYSLFGRMASTAAAAGQTLAAAAGAEPGAVRTAGVIPALSALVTLAVLIILVRRWGRVWCSTVCPVGAFLSWPARL